MGLSLTFGSKVRTAEDAAALISDGDCITVSGTVAWMLPNRVLRAIEVRFLSEGTPAGLTWFDPFPTGVPGIEPLSYPGLLKRVIGGWFTPHPRLREMICADEVEAYMYPLGSLAFWLQAMAAGRDHYLTRVGLDTYLDPRNGGGKLNARTTEELVRVVDLAGEAYIAYQKLRVDAAILRGTVVDEEGNLSFEDEHCTMSVLYQALAAKRFGGKVIAQAARMVPAGQIPARLVTVPGMLVDAIVIDPDQPHDDMFPDMDWITPWSRVPRPPANVLATPSREVWKRWLIDGAVDEAVPPHRQLVSDILIGRRAACEFRRGDVLNIGQGLPARDILPVAIEEGLDTETVLSIETGHLGGIVNGLGFRSNATAILDTPAIFSLYGSGLVNAAFFSMLEFDAEGSVNLLRYGDTWVGPGGSMDIAETVNKVVFCGTLRAAGLRAEGRDGKFVIQQEGAVPRAVNRLQGVCFLGPKMLEQGKEVLYITERAVFRLTGAGPELIEVAPGVDAERDVIGQMEFRPVVSPALREMDPRIFTAGVMGLKERWG
jgi:acyl CoA:acetate/3-ketoacid CoA transferase